jgi:hypothetical protein
MGCHYQEHLEVLLAGDKPISPIWEIDGLAIHGGKLT